MFQTGTEVGGYMLLRDPWIYPFDSQNRYRQETAMGVCSASAPHNSWG